MTASNILDIFDKITNIKSGGVIERYGFNDFLEVAREVRTKVTDDIWLEVGWDILEGMGLEELSGCDYDILTALEHIPSDSDLIDIQTFLRHTLVETLLEQFESGGTTALLDIERMVGTPADVLIPKILDLRREEMENTVITVVGKEVILYDVFMNMIGTITEPKEPVILEDLWLTAYGCQVLSAMHLGLKTDLITLSKIKAVLEKMELTLNIEWSERVINKSHVNMSEAMKTLILRRASNLKR
ncbi:hypothetical protein EU527_02240 [Candidatus Thorarchaeota archaeon]|nr:MAG: hypothetical protein EU527_02240 [Candidatus Thorarchaeota archaeon]